jgi:maltose alpha-D-glucosyltransferase/alpha-amylase
MNNWYNNAIAYALDIGVFNDSNGDGIGDFKGATQKLDYLVDLGINCVWLLPFYYSPEQDNGYDVVDYYLVNPKFGTTDDFVEFLQEAEKRSIRVLLDLVINHTSIQHPWFKAARYNPDSSYYNYYVWRDELPDEPEENVFMGEESGTWKYDEQAKKYYHHKFYHFEADLNIQNPQVREEIKRIMEYWLDFGISGFRIDAATRLFGQFGEDNDGPSPKEILQEFHEFVADRKEGGILLAEADVEPEEIELYSGEGDRMHMLFNFLLNNNLFLAIARQEATPLMEGFRTLPELPEGVHWMNFIRNLDELDLERLTLEERQEVFQALAPNPKMQIYNRGIRRRIAPMLQGNPARLKMVFSLLFAFPGAPLIAYGDELGMGDNLAYGARQAVRTPMQWSSEHNGGFSSKATHEIPITPINYGIFSYTDINAEDQMKDSSSLYNQVKELIRVRKENGVIGWQSPTIVQLEPAAVLGLKYGEDDKELLIFINLSSSPKIVEPKEDISTYRPVLEDGPYGIQEEQSKLSLRAYGFRWFKKNGSQK